MPYTGFTPGGLYYDPEAIERGSQAKQQQQLAFSQATQAGRPLYGNDFRLNQQGAPIFGPTTGSAYQESIFFEAPTAAVSQRLAEMGLTTHRSNPFVGFALALAEGLPTLWEITKTPGSSGESMLAGFTSLAQSIPQLLLSSPNALAGTPLSRSAVSQALRNFAMGNVLEQATPDDPFGAARFEAGIVENLIRNLGSLWFTPIWRRVALNELQQKWDDFQRYLATNPGTNYSFIQFLVDTGFVDRYFG